MPHTAFPAGSGYGTLWCCFHFQAHPRPTLSGISSCGWGKSPVSVLTAPNLHSTAGSRSQGGFQDIDHLVKGGGILLAKLNHQYTLDAITFFQKIIFISRPRIKTALFPDSPIRRKAGDACPILLCLCLHIISPASLKMPCKIPPL